MARPAMNFVPRDVPHEVLVDRYRQARATVWRQRKELRSLNRSLRLEQLVHRAGYTHRMTQIAQLKMALGEERVRTARTDYRSVCRCWTCRLREWYRFHVGITHPGRPGWRFPWARR